MNKQIVFWIPLGRLGNLIFQYQAAISMFPQNSRIFSLESEFSDVFDPAPLVTCLRMPKMLRSIATVVWTGVLRWCANKGFLGSIIPEEEVIHGKYPIETLRITRKQGQLSSFWVVEGWFQHDRYALPLPTLKRPLLVKAEALLDPIPYHRRVAVHLRFGDYAQWTIFGKQGACLPGSYYRSAMARLEMRIKDPVYIIFSDDRKRAEEAMGRGNNTIYFDGTSPGEDLAGISRCGHAIISASTFSWWGAYLISNPDRIVIAPKYWAGFKTAVWYPADIETKAFEYIEVCDGQPVA